MVFRNKNVKQRSIIKNKVLQEGRMIMKKKIIIAAGILVVIAVGAGVYLNHPSGGGGGSGDSGPSCRAVWNSI